MKLRPDHKVDMNALREKAALWSVPDLPPSPIPAWPPNHPAGHDPERELHVKHTMALDLGDALARQPQGHPSTTALAEHLWRLGWRPGP